MNNSESVFGHKLSIRTYNALTAWGNLQTKEQVLDCYSKGNLLKIRNFGKVSYNEVVDWLDKEFDLKQKPIRFLIKQNKPKPLTPSQRQLRSLGYMRTEISNLRAEIQQMSYTLEQWADANYALHRILTVVGTERKYTPPTDTK